MVTEFMIFYDFTLRYDTLSIDNEREHARSHSYKVMDAYKRALYRCHVICTDLFSIYMFFHCTSVSSVVSKRNSSSSVILSFKQQCLEGLVIYQILTSPNPTSKKTFRFIETFCSSNGSKNAGMPIIKSAKAVEKQQSNSSPQIKYMR
ncbi:hypothetical protein V6N13_131737 [Hibiscus sabdariffa]|uniref:Uncharacterized protein n=1 Tax=Hibiscus sabdariffa TaxID=183260 RepID=A0ABR2D8S7_9ROSI